MVVQSVESRRAQLDAIFKRAASAGADAELQAHLARYLCVLVSGFVEQSVRDILASHAQRNHPARAARYVDRTVSRQNVNTSVLLQLVEHFDTEWRDKLHAFVEGERKAALDSVVTNRHAIAHGRPSSISYVQINTYYSQVKEILRYLDQLTA